MKATFEYTLQTAVMVLAFIAAIWILLSLSGKAETVEQNKSAFGFEIIPAIISFYLFQFFAAKMKGAVNLGALAAGAVIITIILIIFFTAYSGQIAETLKYMAGSIINTINSFQK